MDHSLNVQNKVYMLFHMRTTDEKYRAELCMTLRAAIVQTAGSSLQAMAVQHSERAPCVIALCRASHRTSQRLFLEIDATKIGITSIL